MIQRKQSSRGHVTINPSAVTRRCAGVQVLRIKDPFEDVIVLPQDFMEVRLSDNRIHINGIEATVDSYKILVPEKVVQTNFIDGSYERTVLQEGDTFNLDTAIRIAIAKHVGRHVYNFKGIEALAVKLSYYKCIDKMLEKVHKKYRREQKQAEKDAAKAKMLQERQERQAKKRAEKEERRKWMKHEVSIEDVRESLKHECPSSVHAEIDPNKVDYHSETSTSDAETSSTTGDTTVDSTNTKLGSKSSRGKPVGISNAPRRHINIKKTKHAGSSKKH